MRYLVTYAMPQEQPLKSLVIAWARECHGDVSVHPFDSTYKKFLTFTNSNTRTGITVVYYTVKDHHCCPVTDYNLKIAPTKVNQRSFSDLLKHMSDITWT